MNLDDRLGMLESFMRAHHLGVQALTFLGQELRVGMRPHLLDTALSAGSAEPPPLEQVGGV